MDREHRLREFSYSIKSNKINILGISVKKKKEREKRAESLFEEIIAENIPNMGKERDRETQEAQRNPMKINKSRPTPRHIIV